jgi:hypothetical protein
MNGYAGALSVAADRKHAAAPIDPG